MFFFLYVPPFNSFMKKLIVLKIKFNAHTKASSLLMVFLLQFRLQGIEPSSASVTPIASKMLLPLILAPKF